MAVAARNAEKLASLVAEIESDGGTALAVPMDVADGAQVKAGFQQALAKFGRLRDSSVNNAAITKDTLALRMKLERLGRGEHERTLPARICASSKPWARCSNNGPGASSISLRWLRRPGNAGQANYVASKAGSDRAYAGHRGGSRVAQHHRNSAHCSGFVETPMTDVLSQELNRTKLKTLIPLGRLGTDL